MVVPRKVRYYAQKKEKENIRVRSWLKTNADPDELDLKFKHLHEELFAEYDCSRCRNCCREYHGLIPKKDLEKDAECLNLSVEDFRNRYLQAEEDVSEEGYYTKSKPCDFLQESGECILGVCKPVNCVQYPYTDQPDRIGSLLSFLQIIEVCPVAYEICERLKIEYGFLRMV